MLSLFSKIKSKTEKLLRKATEDYESKKFIAMYFSYLIHFFTSQISGLNL